MTKQFNIISSYNNLGGFIMKIKKSGVMATLLLGAIFLAGCSSNNANNSTSKKATTTAVNHTKSSVKKTLTVESSTKLWDNTKDAKLKKFIDQWAPTMNQSYVKYDGTHPLKLSTGTTYPNNLKNITVNGDHPSIGWNKNGNGNYKYNVVAIYNYNGSASHITYLFAFHNNDPIVLVDQSASGTPNFLPTENSVLKTGFENIASGKSAELSSTTSSNNSNSDGNDENNSSTQSTPDLKIVGLMLYELQGNLDISQDQDTSRLQLNTPTDGRYRIDINTTESALPFTVEGNTAHYWTRLYNGIDTRPDGTVGPSPETEHTISLKDLESKYYSTADQKQKLDQIAAQMPVK